MSALYRKYRPQTFTDVFGQEHVVRTLEQAVAQNRVAHAYLFSGPRGVGKTTLARLLAKAVNCLDKKKKPCGKCKNCQDIAAGRFIDLIEIDAASNRGIDEIRELRDKIRFAPSVGEKKVYIIDEVHMLTKEAFNALLKTLEEPPEHSIFIFATTEVSKLPETVLSRCQRFDFRLGDEDLISKNLKKVAVAEKLKLNDEILKLIVRSSGGSFRDSLSALDQLSSHLVTDGIGVHEALKVLNLTALDQVVSFVEILNLGEANRAISYIDDLSAKGVDFEQFTNQTIVYLRRELIESLKSGEADDWVKTALERLIESVSQAKLTPVDSLALELAAIDVCEAQTSKVKSEKLKVKSNPIQNTIDNPPKPESIQKVEISGPKAKEIEVEIHPVKSPQKGVPEGQFNRVKDFSADQKRAIIEQVTAQNKPLGFLLGSAIWKKDNDGLILTVEYPLHRNKIMSTGALKILSGEIKKVVGADIEIKCIVEKQTKEDTVDGNIGEEIDEVFG